MKSTKLSLVALIAIGAFGTTLSASPLEEAIKG
ncbi:MAG: major outer membrane protein, partial [Campylobacteraceae bacterium]|nr:major outer membrane protein [Campylobacteraceae bacterium]